jgi:amino acid transporter
VRDRSGFVRGFNPWDVFMFNVLGYATGLSLATNPTILGGLYPRAEIHWVLVFGLVLSVFCGVLYGIYSGMWPRSGGDYLYISRTLNPCAGFVANWGFTWSQIYGIGVFSGWAIRDALSPAFVTFGHTVHSPACVGAGHWLAQPGAICAGGVCLLLLCLLVSVLEAGALKRVLTGLFLVALASTVLLLVPFFGVTHDDFVVRFNQFMREGTGLENAYEAVIDLARKEGLEIGQPASIWESFKALPVGFLIFFGFTYSVYVGGEVREPQKSQAVGILGALLFGFVVSWLGMGRYYEVVGRDFNNAVAVVKGLPDSPLPAGGSMIFFAGVLTDNPVASAVMNFGSFLWFFLLPVVMTQVCIRNVFAWAFDRVLPPWFADVSRGNRVWHAAVAILAAAAVFLALDSLLGFPYVNYITLFSVCMLTTGVAGLLFPFVRPELYRTAPAFARRRFLGVPVLSVAGAATAGMFAVVLYSALTNSAFSGVQAGLVPHMVLVVVYAAGLVLWLWVARRRTQGGLDPKMLYQNLPPE